MRYVPNACGHERATRFGQPRWSPAPAKLALRLFYLVVVDGGFPPPHQAALIELPQLIPMTSPPAPLRVVALVLEPDRDAVTREAPQVLLQPVIQLPCPLAPQEVPDRLAPFEELVAVAPLGVLRVGERNLLGVAGVPGVLGRLDLLPRRLLIERWYRRSDVLVLPALLHVLLHSAFMLASRGSYADATAALGSSIRVRSILVGMLRC